MSEDELERLEAVLEELGPRFCTTLTSLQIDEMKDFISFVEEGKVDRASRTLESLDFIHTVASKICMRGGK